MERKCTECKGTGCCHNKECPECKGFGVKEDINEVNWV